MKNLNIIKKKEGDNWFKRNFKLYNQDIREITISNLIKSNSTKAKSILEIGCANGMRLNQYQNELKSKINYGIDLSKKSISHGKKKYKKLKLFKLSSLEIEKIKINFDLIICGSFLYLLDRHLIFKQFDLISKKLNKNGYLIIQDFDPLFKHTNNNMHNKNFKTFKMSYDNFLEESGLFKMIYKKRNNSKLIKTNDKKKFKSDDWCLTLFKKIDFEESYPTNV